MAVWQDQACGVEIVVKTTVLSQDHTTRLYGVKYRSLAATRNATWHPA